MTDPLQSLSVITLGIDDLARSRRFYSDGFGWAPVFENPEILFYQMNGFVFGTWLRSAMAEELQLPAPLPSGGFTLAHNVPGEQHVEPLLDRLVEAGGRLIRAADSPPQGGLRGYVADPDGHPWEIAWNPAWPIDAQGHVHFAS
jgi:catechol 2,3-dioxygenase-like lactoylglutathione lyase family enzyme